jgi:hypothetical protein
MEGGYVSVVWNADVHVAETVITITFPPPASTETYFTHLEEGRNTFLRNFQTNSASYMV